MTFDETMLIIYSNNSSGVIMYPKYTTEQIKEQCQIVWNGFVLNALQEQANQQETVK